MLRRRGWLAGCLSHAGIVSKRLNLSQNLFDHLVAPIILVSSDPCADIQFQGEPLQRGDKYTGVGKLSTFDGNRRLSRKRCEIGRWLLWNVNKKSWVQDWMVSFSMILTHNPGFSRLVYTYKSNISKRCVLGTKLLKNTNRKQYHSQWHWMTFDPDFKVATFFDIEYLRNDTR